MKFSWNECNRIIDINKNNTLGGEKEKAKVFFKLLIVCALRLWKIWRFAVSIYLNPALHMVAHIFRLENLKENMQILKAVAHFPTFPKHKSV